MARQRVDMYLDSDQVDQMDAVAARCGLRNRTDFVIHAVNLAIWMLEQAEAGGQAASVMPGNWNREYHTAAFDAIRRKWKYGPTRCESVLETEGKVRPGRAVEPQ